MKINIIKAQIDHTSHVVMCLREMHAGLEEHDTPIDDRAAISHITRVITDGICLLAVTEDNRTAGCLGAELEYNWYSSTNPHLADSFFFVKEEFRTTRAGILLMKNYIAFAKERELPIHTAHQFSQLDQMDKKDKFYERLGYKKVGSVFTL